MVMEEGSCVVMVGTRCWEFLCVRFAARVCNTSGQEGGVETKGREEGGSARCEGVVLGEMTEACSVKGG